MCNGWWEGGEADECFDFHSLFSVFTTCLRSVAVQRSNGLESTIKLGLCFVIRPHGRGANIDDLRAHGA